MDERPREDMMAQRIDGEILRFTILVIWSAGMIAACFAGYWLLYEWRDWSICFTFA